MATTMQSVQPRKSYGPPRRPVYKPYSPKLEAIENFKNKIINAEYLPYITEHLKTLEDATSVNPTMIDLQPEVKWYMRPYLVNFIVQMHSSLKLKPQTLFLCWNIIDRYCAKRIAFKQHYQLIGCTSLWIASKYEDKKSRVPTVKELNTMCSNVYDDSMFREMEVHILSTLNWSIGHTTLEDILQLAVKYSDPDGKEQLDKPIELYKGNTPTVSAILAVSRYLCELTLYERSYLTYSTSQIGITCFLMACSILNMDVGTNYINNIYHNFESSMNLTRTNEKILHDKVRLNYNLFNFKHSDTDDIFHEDDEDDLGIDSDAENVEPLKNNYGPFIAGFNGIETINDLRVIALSLFKSILDPSEVLVEKYTSLGVMTVVRRFIEENELTQIDLSLLKNTGSQSTSSPSSSGNIDANSTANSSLVLTSNDKDNSSIVDNPYALELTNLLLSFNDSCVFNLRALSALRDFSITSATSTSSESISYTRCDSPSNFSSFSSVSSATSYSFSPNSTEFPLGNNDYREKLI